MELTTAQRDRAPFSAPPPARRGSPNLARNTFVGAAQRNGRRWWWCKWTTRAAC